MTSLAHTLSGLMGQAFEALWLPPSFGAVRVSDRPDLAQFQCNGAMGASKTVGKSPREVAQEIIDHLQALPQSPFTKLDIAGPGFINLNITDDYLAAFLAEVAADAGRLGVPAEGAGEAIVLDYGGPNIAKAMHVGHLRSAVIGDCLRRIVLFAGFSALGDIHMGDWGTHMGMLTGDYMRKHETDLVLSTDIADPESVQRLMEDMAVRYPAASGAAKTDPALMKAAQETTVRLQDKRAPEYALWEIIRAVSVVGMKRNYDSLGITFDLWDGESSVHDRIAPMVKDLEAAGIAEKSQGAVVVSVAEAADKKEMPPLILYKSDGAVMYGTTDLATIGQRVENYNPSRILYVVDQRQSLHFEQVFRAARKGGLVRADTELTHAGFGTVNGTDGKPFKTRDGGVMRLEDMLALGLEKARVRLEEAALAKDMSPEEREEIAHKIAIAAIKFADLQNNRMSDYVFDLDRMTSFEGKTGPYILYQAVRITSLLRKAAGQNMAYEDGVFVFQEGDRALALLLAEFPDHFGAALKYYTPHVLCDYVFRLAQAYSTFYGNCPVLSEPDPTLRASRLRLSSMVHAQITLILGLLGIDTPERM